MTVPTNAGQKGGTAEGDDDGNNSGAEHDDNKADSHDKDDGVDNDDTENDRRDDEDETEVATWKNGSWSDVTGLFSRRRPGETEERSAPAAFWIAFRKP